MTNELEKQFFQCFGIEAKLTFYNLIKVKENDTTEYSTRCSANYNNESKEETIRRHSSNGWKVIKCEDIYTYPQITDRILLELIRIIGFITIKYTNGQCEICYGDGAVSYLGEDLKEAILNFLISKVSIFKHQVRTLFKEG